MTPSSDPTGDPLDDSGEGMPASPARRRVAMAVGILMLIVILGLLTWFAVHNTETAEERGPILGGRAPAAGSFA